MCDEIEVKGQLRFELIKATDQALWVVRARGRGVVAASQ
jgi:hypothetical protein